MNRSNIMSILVTSLETAGITIVSSDNDHKSGEIYVKDTYGNEFTIKVIP